RSDSPSLRGGLALFGHPRLAGGSGALPLGTRGEPMTEKGSVRALVVDDEAPARRLIREFLKEYPWVEVTGEAASGPEAIRLAEELDPDLLFLDIQMPKVTGLEVLELLPGSPRIVFVTAFDEYAVRAFEENALDYLLK